MNNDFHGSSRYSNRAKRKKTNLVLNGLIVFVILLISIVAYSIFFSGNDNASTQKVAKTSAVDKLKKDTGSNSTAAANNKTGNSSTNKQTSDKTSTKDKTDNSTADTGQANDASQQLQTVQNPNSDTSALSSQSKHTTNYDSNSADWQSMLQSISTATGIDQNNMTVWFLGSDKSTANGSVGTVSAKSNQQKYRVYLQWVDGKGYQATKVEQVSQ